MAYSREIVLASSTLLKYNKPSKIGKKLKWLEEHEFRDLCFFGHFYDFKDRKGETIFCGGMDKHSLEALAALAKAAKFDSSLTAMKKTYYEGHEGGMGGQYYRTVEEYVLPENGLLLNARSLKETSRIGIAVDPREDTDRFLIRSKAMNYPLAAVSWVAKAVTAAVEIPFDAARKVWNRLPDFMHKPIAITIVAAGGILLASQPALLYVIGAYVAAKLYRRFIGGKAEGMLADFEPVKKNLESLIGKD